MMRLKNFKRTELIIVVFVLCTVNVGCSHIDRQEQEQNITKTEQEETVVSLPIPSTEDIEISEKKRYWHTKTDRNRKNQTICGRKCRKGSERHFRGAWQCRGR